MKLTTGNVPGRPNRAWGRSHGTRCETEGNRALLRHDQNLWLVFDSAESNSGPRRNLGLAHSAVPQSFAEPTRMRGGAFPVLRAVTILTLHSDGSSIGQSQRID